MRIDKVKIAGLLIIFVTFFSALAVMDYSAMHLRWENDWLYKYWIGMGLVVTAFAFTVSYVCWIVGLPKRIVYALFFTVILLFVAGLLDLFYFVLATLRGESYGFEIWSAQFKWLGTWGWPQQIIWTSICLVIAALMWKKVLER